MSLMYAKESIIMATIKDIEENQRRVQDVQPGVTEPFDDLLAVVDDPGGRADEACRSHDVVHCHRPFGVRWLHPQVGPIGLSHCAIRATCDSAGGH